MFTSLHISVKANANCTHGSFEAYVNLLPFSTLSVGLNQENDHLNRNCDSQSGMSCHFSLSWHCQKIRGWGWLAGAGVPTHPVERDREVKKHASCKILLTTGTR